MERSVANILFVLSLGAALAVAVAARPASTSGDVAAIRLPSDTKGLDSDEIFGAMKKGGEEDERPWTCCDDALCSRTKPKFCGCRDVVTKCARACQSCDEVFPGRYLCLDVHKGSPGPKCTHKVHLAGAGN